MAETPGERAFDVYKATRLGRGIDGQKLPKWKQLSPEKQAEWEAAANTLTVLLEQKAEHGKN